MNEALGIHSHIVQDPMAEKATELVRQWVDDCNDAEKHPLCTPVQKQEKVTLPTRVVAVGPADGSKLPKLVETHGEEGSYIALSHCWGKTQIITTTKATIASRKESIEWSLLSQTFQDAITWTRRLGIPYIWIDSLCIVQDDLQDWATESTKMGTIYEHAHLTLAATAAPSGTLGFRSPRTPPQSFHLRDTPHRVSAQLQPSHDSFTRRSQADPRLMPLLSRAWVYQERLLSARVAHFGARELVFECQNGYACECGGISRYSGLTSHNTSVKQEYRDALLGARDAAYTWEAVVRGYTACALSFEQDRLPALSATARRLEGLLGAYRAGLWERMLPDALFWKGDAYVFEHPAAALLMAGAWKPGRRSGARDAPPSWSWAAVEGAVVNLFYHLSTSKVKVVDVHTKPLLLDRYGSVAEGRITVVGPVARVGAEVIVTDTGAGKQAHYMLSRDGLKHEFFQDVEISEHDASQALSQGLFCLIGGYDHKTCVTLILRPTKADAATYERVGLTTEVPPEWVSLAEEATITLI